MTAAPKKTSPLDEALAHQQRGELAAAEAGFRAVLAQDADNPDASILLGEICRKSGHAEEAVGLVKAAIAAAPKRSRKVEPSWRVALAYAKRDSGDVEGGLAEIEALLAAAPGTPELLFLRAGMLQRLDRHEDAIADYEAILKPAPDYVQALNNLGVSLKIAGRLKEALECFDKAAKIQPKYIEAIGNLGELLLDMGQAEAAIANLRRAHALDPENRKAESALIDALQVGEKAEEAERLAEKVHRRDPDDPKAMVQLGNIRMVMGQRESAVELARRAKTLTPRAPGVLSLLAEAEREADSEALLAEIESVIADGQDFGPRIGLHFAAARLCEKLKRHPDAFAHYAAGNAVRRDQLERFDKGYDRATAEARVDRLIAAFDAENFAGPAGGGSSLPIFIVGMPRSGTTLTEQILASHPKAAGAGELSEVSQIVGWLTAQHDYPEKLPVERLKEAAAGYLKHVGKVGRGAARVTDKMPGNFMNLGLIARMFSGARIIHTRRDPMDNCLSCFAQNFRADGLAWSCDLEDLAHQYCQYRRIMDHWRKVLPPGRMLEIDYEDTVADLEGQARRIVDFVGLAWDDSCLRFHETERAVATASREQVRRPIYTSSVGRWKRYDDGVLPLARALDACGCGPDAPAADQAP